MLGALLGAGEHALTVPEARFKWGLLPFEAQGLLDLSVSVDHLRKDWKFSLWGIDLPAQVPSRRVRYATLLSALVRLHAEQAGTTHRPVWIDHTPGNLSFAASLARLLPEARFVHVIRDGRAVAASIMPLDWGPNDITSAARLWAARLGICLGAVQRLGPERACTVRYEDLVQSPERTLGQLRDFLDLPSMPDAAPGDGGVFASPEGGYQLHAYTARQHALVRRPPDPSRADAWRDELTARQVEAFEAVTGELLAYFGYELEVGARARPLPRSQRMVESVGGKVRRVTRDRVRRRKRRRTLEGGS